MTRLPISACASAVWEEDAKLLMQTSGSLETAILSTSTPAALGHAVQAAVSALAAGDAVALPTETVYGLAADALRPEALLKIFAAKERPFFDPLILHLPDREWLERLCEIPAASRSTVEAFTAAFWPGALTLVLPKRSLVPDLATSGLETVAVRLSAHLVFQTILATFGQPLAAPSANRFGRISPTLAEHVVAELAGRISLIVDGGACQHGVESTILSVQGAEWQILRAGPITAEMLRETAPWAREKSALSAPPAASFSEKKLSAPGQLPSHYAPRTPLFWRADLAALGLPENARAGLLAWAKPSLADLSAFSHVEVLSPGGDVREAAATLFAKMRRLDAAELDYILAEPVPEIGLGIAIMDRLRRAAFRDETLPQK